MENIQHNAVDIKMRLTLAPEYSRHRYRPDSDKTHSSRSYARQLHSAHNAHYRRTLLFASLSLMDTAQANLIEMTLLSTRIRKEYKLLEELHNLYKEYLSRLKVETLRLKRDFTKFTQANSTWWNVIACANTKTYHQRKYLKPVHKKIAQMQQLKPKALRVAECLKDCSMLMYEANQDKALAKKNVVRYGNDISRCR